MGIILGSHGVTLAPVKRGRGEANRQHGKKENGKKRIAGTMSSKLQGKRKFLAMGYVKHIGTKTMRMKRLSQTVTAVVDFIKSPDTKPSRPPPSNERVQSQLLSTHA